MMTKYVIKMTCVERTENHGTTTKIIQRIYGTEKEAINVFKNIIANNFYFEGNKVQSEFFIIRRTIDVENFSAEDYQLYYAYIFKDEITGVGNHYDRANLIDLSESQGRYMAFQKEINEALSTTENFFSIEGNEGKISYLYGVIKETIKWFDKYWQDKRELDRYNRLIWWKD